MSFSSRVLILWLILAAGVLGGLVMALALGVALERVHWFSIVGVISGVIAVIIPATTLWKRLK